MAFGRTYDTLSPTNWKTLYRSASTSKSQRVKRSKGHNHSHHGSSVKFRGSPTRAVILQEVDAEVIEETSQDEHEFQSWKSKMSVKLRKQITKDIKSDIMKAWRGSIMEQWRADLMQET